MPPQTARPLARQLLLPVVGLLVAGVLANVGFAAWLAARRHGEEIALRQRQVAETLASSRVAFSPAVLNALASLTGNHFVVWGQQSVVQSTLPFAVEPELTRALGGLLGPVFAFDTSLGIVPVAGNRYSVAAVRSTGVRPETVLVLTPTVGYSRALLDAIWPVLAVAAVTLTVLVPLGVHATDRLARRISRIEQHVSQIAAGDFGRTLDDTQSPSGSSDEISRLVVSFNAMSLALARLRDSLAASERQRLLGQLAAGFAHEFRNGLTGARLALDLHRSRCTAASVDTPDESLTVARRQLDIMEEEVHGLLALGSSSEAAHSLVPLDMLLEEVQELVDPRAAHAGVQLTVSTVADGVVLGRRESLRAAVVNLALNAIDAASAVTSNTSQQPAPSHGSVQISAERLRAATGQTMLAVTVEDSGLGPPAELSLSVFDPFVTGKPEGIGIGLALVKMVADEHGGGVSFERTGGRTRFTLTLPEASVAGPESTTEETAQ